MGGNGGEWVEMVRNSGDMVGMVENGRERVGMVGGFSLDILLGFIKTHPFRKFFCGLLQIIY